MPQLHQGTFAGKVVTARSQTVLFNEESGVVTEVSGRRQALRLYLALSVRPGTRPDKLHILRWTEDHWTPIPPESIRS
ncbi:MAG: hypothetical protein DME18_10035 [Verrucomicrobia bacterium]|nr:MAG: hypothetical protein DME19_13245 [Verrucomicrobiota bacterium]PYM13011.1 MAG: hypothetical protein DME18_10035 [Verrucomicrobiota bacterium]